MNGAYHVVQLLAALWCGMQTPCSACLAHNQALWQMLPALAELAGMSRGTVCHL